MTAYVMPPRKWAGDEEPEAPRPVVLVSSRDDAPVPPVAGAVRLAKAAGAAGWTVRQTWAVAVMPATSQRSSFWLASVALRLTRGGAWAVAFWYQRDGLQWKFATAHLGNRLVGARELAAALREVQCTCPGGDDPGTHSWDCKNHPMRQPVSAA